MDFISIWLILFTLPDCGSFLLTREKITRCIRSKDVEFKKTLYVARLWLKEVTVVVVDKGEDLCD